MGQLVWTMKLEHTILHNLRSMNGTFERVVEVFHILNVHSGRYVYLDCRRKLFKSKNLVLVGRWRTTYIYNANIRPWFSCRLRQKWKKRLCEYERAYITKPQESLVYTASTEGRNANFTTIIEEIPDRSSVTRENPESKRETDHLCIFRWSPNFRACW